MPITRKRKLVNPTMTMTPMRLIGLLHGLFGKLAGRGELGLILQDFVSELAESLGATGGYLMAAPDPTNLRLLAETGPIFREEAHDADVIRGFYDEIFRHQRPALAIGRSPEAASLIGVPLVSDERLIGGMVFFRRTGVAPFTLEDMPLLGVVALPLAIHLENVEITRLNQTRRAELEAVLASMVDGLLVVDSWGLVVSFNEAFKSLTQRTPADLYTLYWDDLMEPRSRATEVFEAFNTALRKGERFSSRCAAMIQRPEGRPVPVSISFTTIVEPSGRISGGVLSVRDTTIETQIDQMKDEFLSTVSHELRTPITTISGFVEMMIGREMSRADQLPLLELIYSEAGRLGRLVTDMLDLSKIQSNRLSLSPRKFRVEALLRNVLRPFEAQGGAHRFVLSVEPARGLITADYDRLTQVMVNLVSNAVKYSPEGGTVTVEAKRKRDRWILSVADQGIGIPAEALPHVFDRFYRVNENQTSGSGLGLFITQEIVRGHGGHLGVTSELGTGTTVTVQVPAIAETYAIAKPVATRSQEARARGQ